MPKLISTTPKYRRHKASGRAVVTIAGRDYYLGPWQSKASKLEYDRLVGEWIANRRSSSPQAGSSDMRIVELISAYLAFARSYYIKDGRSTRTAENMRPILKVLRRLYGHTRVEEFGPLALKSIQRHLTEAGKARVYINKQIDMLRRMFKWAASEELVPAAVFHSLKTVSGLRKGHTTAPERPRVRPVSDDVVIATLPLLPPTVADMVQFQRLTGARPAEVCIVRPCDIDTSESVWCYRPGSHKCEHLDRDRLVLIGPRAQAVLRPYLSRPATEHCFRPEESELHRNRERRQNRRTPMTPSQAKRKPKRARRRAPGDHYTTNSYRRAIERACDRIWPAPDGLTDAELKQWHKAHRWAPNRLRHSAGTEIRKRFGLEAAQVTLGHASADVTQVYAERDLELAAKVMQEVG